MCVPNFIASNYQKVITDIFFFVLYWFAPCLKFETLVSENSRCAPVMYKMSNSFVYTYVVNCLLFQITPSGCAL